MWAGSWCLATLLLVTQGSHVFASHFRGSQITWKPLYTPENTVQITHRIAWRRSYSGATWCNSDTVASGNLIGISDLLQCRSGCRGRVGTMDYQCTDFSASEDWSAGEKTYNFTFPNNGSFEISYTGGDWISLVQGGGNWEVRVRLNLTTRNDTGLINTSPRTAMSPIVRLQHGCNHTITIPVNDLDGDVVRCRWAENSKQECAGVCHTFPGAVLNQRKCTIKYSATGSIGWFAIALMIEDFATTISDTPLSSIPLQFLAIVFRSDENCTSQPMFVGNTRADASCIGVPIGTTYLDKIVARSGTKTASIQDINTVSPVGLQKSSLSLFRPQEWYVNVTWTPMSRQQGSNIFCYTAIDDGGILTINTVSPVGLQKSSLSLFKPQEWYVNITWTPMSRQQGSNIFCYTAIDDGGQSTSQRCITLLGGVTPPQFQDGSQHPTGLIYPNHTDWKINVDQDFVRPNRSNFIKFYNSLGQVEYSMDVAITHDVVYPVRGFGRQLTFSTKYSFTEKETYYITMDPGVLKGTTFCGAESPRITDPSFWRFTIRDVTPPTVVFEDNPYRSNANISIKWTSNENTTYICTVQNPSGVPNSIHCNNTYSVTGIQREGYYTIFVQGTDSAENTARPIRHTWFVDLTPPVVTIAKRPTQISNDKNPRISFYCDDRGCRFRCKLVGSGQNGNVVTCSSLYALPGTLQDGESYTFSVMATDDVGNEGTYTSYTWQTDFHKPVISSLAAAVVNCGDDYSPNTIGRPVVTDNLDPSPTVTVTDTTSTSCTVNRVWTATDLAGNSATTVQTISFTNPKPPHISAPTNLIVACNQFPDSTQSTDNDITIHVTHPCNRSVVIAHTDSVGVIRCGTTFTRNWEVTDDCGEVTHFQQVIQILPMQYPDYPQNGQRNVDLRQQLNWPQFPGATSYNVYVWPYNTTKPSTPTTTTQHRYYNPATAYEPGRRMLWQVEYQTSSGTIPSPTWGFESRKYADFVVKSIIVPPQAFSGQSFSVKWTVKNTGGVGSERSSWYDAIYIGSSMVLSDARRVKVVRKNMFLDPNDGYSSVTDIPLRKDDLGSYYVFVTTDIYRNIGEVDRRNNILRSSTSVQVLLTPPPNLVVHTIQVSDSTYSGEKFQVSWTVKNKGTGVTVENSWRDAIYLSQDSILDTRLDTLLTSKYHTGFLSPGDSYAEGVSVTCPNAIHGNYSIIIVTDVDNRVYEHSSDNDNTKVAEGGLNVILSPPPDLIVEELRVNRELFYTGDVVVVDYTVTNNGIGEPFERWWSDSVYITALPNGNRQLISSTTFSGSLKYGESYSRQVKYDIHVDVTSGKYAITVHTDAKNNVFEYKSDNNNEKQTNVRFTQVKADLKLERVAIETKTNSTAAYVSVVYTTRNIASGGTFAAPWVDNIYIARSSSINDNTRHLITQFTRQIDVQADESYTTNLKDIEIPSSFHGNLYVHVSLDYYSRVLEEDSNNNIGSSDEFNSPVVLPDLNPVEDKFQLLSKSSIYAGAEITVTWEIQNGGNRDITNKRWTDSIFLSVSNVYDATSFKLHDENILMDVMRSGTYTVNTTFKLPESSFGHYYLLLLTDVMDTVIEGNEKNNVASLPLTIFSIPSPDLVVEDVRFILEQNAQFITVTWTIGNQGNSMMVERHWCDDVILSKQKDVFSGSDARKIGTKCMSINLNAFQELSNKKAFLIPSALQGKYWVYVITDARKNILEINAESNNIAFARLQVDIPNEEMPQLDIVFRSSIPETVQAGETVAVDILVTNKDVRGLVATSWTDGLFSYPKKDTILSEVMEYGLLIKDFIHNGGLSSGKSYSVKANVRIPYSAPRNGYLYFITDINSRTGSTSSMKSTPVDVTIGNLPDLLPIFSSFPKIFKSGQPYNLSFNIKNQGNASVTMVTAYSTLYFSRDVLIDPFDIKLKSRLTTLTMKVGAVQGETVEVFIPYDLVSGQYYIILKVDSRNEVYESDEMNNEVHVLVTLEEMLSTDIEVTGVTLSDVALQFGQDFDVSWKLRNLGALVADGYKCESIYLSQDDKWDMKDVQVESAKCRSMKLNPYISGSVSDHSQSNTAVSLKTPLLPRSEYKGLVRLRSNIRELNLDNNVGVSTVGVNITFPVINIASTKVFNLLGNSEKAFLIPNVDPEETLVVRLRSLNGKGSHYLFIRHDNPATGYAYDAASMTPFSSNQNLIAPNTQEGDYYLLVENTDTEKSQVEVTVKLAKFEIIETSPKKAASVGDVTIRIDGTLFPEVLTASLRSDKNTITSSKLYRFTSTEAYATFALTSALVGQEFDLELRDVRKSTVAKFPKALTIVNGIEGRLKVSGKTPRAMRPMEIGTLIIDYQNTGNTDINGGIILVSSTGIGELQLMENGQPISSFGASHMILASPMNGPAGLSSPQSYGRKLIQVRQKESGEIGRMPFTVSIMSSSQEAHPYIGKREQLKPAFLTTSAWEQTWTNCLKIVGKTLMSFSQRMADIGSQMSLAGRGAMTVETLFRYVMRISDGAVVGDEMLSFVDLKNKAGSPALLLHIQRIYSSLLSKRRTLGLFGIGWTSPLWEMKVLKYSNDVISILYNREELVLTAQPDSGIYKDEVGNEAHIDGKEIRFLEGATFRTFSFDVKSKLLLRIVSGASEEITLQHSAGRLVKVKSVKDGEMYFAYNDDGYVRTVEIHDAEGKMVEFSLYEYSPERKSHLASVTKGSNSVKYTYTDDGDLESVVYANGRRTVFKYDSNYWLSETAGYSLSGELMSSIQFETDYNGKLVVTETPRQTSSEYLYDENLNVASILGEDGVRVKYLRSRQNGRKILHGDQVLLDDTMDITTNTRSLKDGNGNRLQVVYDADGQITSVTDGRGNKYQSPFKDGRLSSITYPDKSEEAFVYDNNGKIIKQTLRNGGHVQFDYDEKQHLISRTTSTDSTYLTYDREGHVSEARNTAGAVHVDYNKVGLPTRVVLPGGKQLHYGYNKAEQRTFLRDETGEYNITYHYDNKDKLVEVKQNGIRMLKLDYEKGFLKKRTLGNGAYTEYVYNFNSGLLLSLHNHHPNGSLVDKFEYQYDSRWRRVRMVTLDGTWTYRYDAASQLTHFEDPSGKVVHYRYDRSKNRISEEIGNKKTGYSVNSLNQYEGVGDVKYTYDRNGNVHQKLESGTVTEVHTFDDSNRLVETQTDVDRCKYVYDAMGNLYKKNCSASGLTTFIVDPFGLQGISNVIGQISGGETTYYVHAEDQGLVAMLDHHGDQLFYQFDSQGSVTTLMHSNGSLANSYSYDPFGKLLHSEETRPNDFCFVGQWGVRREKEVPGKYQMRARYYDAKLGRFISPDPMGMPGPGLKNVNLYNYAENNPVTYADPQGRILFAVIAAGAAIGAITNGIVYAATSTATGTFSWGGLGGAVVGGGITGAGITLGAAFSPLAGAGIAIVGGFVGGFTGSAVQQGIDTQSFNMGEALNSAAWSAATAWLPWKMLGYGGKGGATAFGNPYAWRNMNFGSQFWRSLTGKGLKTTRALWHSLGLGNIIGNLSPLAYDWMKQFQECCLDELWNDFLEWIRSRDPNDILGPAGYGDAHFIAKDTELEYTIRFENAANATAPAQKVFIVHQLDADLEIRTFKVGSFGFGNFTKEIQNGRPILQETVDLEETRGIGVRVRAGIDIVNGLVTWDIQTLDPATGQSPTDPSVGFLPPNNDTTGQGFVKFSVSPKKNVTHMSTIDAEAKIIFDQNEPIDTPPIFNTIDSAAPSANLSLVDDLVKEGTLAVTINKFDSGSGVRAVDIYQKLKNDTVYPLLAGVQSDVTVLPLMSGDSYQILLVPQDHVGNQQPFDVEDNSSYVTVHFPNITVSCDGVNNCSGHGNCLQKNFCQCQHGYYGDDCSSDTPPPEPPLLEARSSPGVEDIPVSLFLSAKLVNTTQESGILSVEIYDILDGVTFNKGQVKGQMVVLTQQEFGEVKMTTKPHFSGQVIIKVKAVLNRNGQIVSRGGVLTLEISPVADKPTVSVEKICYDTNTHQMALKFVPLLQDASENLTVSLTGIPVNVKWSGNIPKVSNISVVSGQQVEITLTQKGTFSPFTLTLDVFSTEKANRDVAIQTTKIKIEKCETKDSIGSASQMTPVTLFMLLCCMMGRQVL